MKQSGLLKKMTIRRRFTISVLVVVVIVMSVFGIVWIMSTADELTKELDLKIDTTSDLAMIAFSDPLWNYNYEGIGATGNALLQDNEIGLVELKTNIGREVYNQQKEEGAYEDQYLLFSERMIYRDDIYLGTLTIGFTKYYRGVSLFNEMIAIIVSIMILSLLLWLALSYVSRVVTVPIYELSKGTDEIAKGNLEKRLFIDSGDEIGELAWKFNAMAENLQIRTLEREQAEEELLQKTDELMGAYEQLTATESELRDNYEELSRIQRALEQARKKLNLLNTVTFQDIRNAVFSLSGYLELDHDLQSSSKIKGYTEQEKQIIQDISSTLEFARMYQDMGISPPRWHNVKHAVLYAISHLDMSMIARKDDLDGLEIYADPLLEKVFYKLAENVLVHGQSVTEISLTYEETPEGLILVFEDNGIGIPDSEKEKIFSKGYGSQKGMGLFLAREILGITGITIKETGKEGEGARFEMLVPKGAYQFV